MNKRIKSIVILIIVLLMSAQVAMAENCHFTFEHKGVTYNVIHYTGKNSYIEVTNAMPISYSDEPGVWMSTYSDEYSDYLMAQDAAVDAHFAQYHSELGDNSMPMYLLSGIAMLTAIGAIFVHRKRMSIG